jgi:hypothetical protein
MERDTKVTIGFVVAAVIILAAQMLLLWTGPASATTQQQGLPDRESDGDLEDVGLNAEVFNTGDTITISGSIDNPTNEGFVEIEVVDPEGEIVASDFPTITADDTFTYRFEAGNVTDAAITTTAPMTVGGNYKVTVTYYEATGDFDINEVDVEFKYIVTARAAQEQTQQNQAQGQPPIDRDNDDDDDDDDLREDLEEGFEGLL